MGIFLLVIAHSSPVLLLNYFVAQQVPRLVTVVKHGVRGVGYNFWLY